ncbi:MAG: double zinc ribbon domain-containing protein [Candidatus Helarchaeota archaeon]
MPIKRKNDRVFKEIKVYTLKRLLKRKIKYRGSAKEAEDYQKLEAIFFGKNLNPFKVLDRGIVTAADVQEAINELENAGLIDIDDDNKLTLTDKGEGVAQEIKDITKLIEIDDNLLVGNQPPMSTEAIPEPIQEPIEENKMHYVCPDCDTEILEPKNFCPKCGRALDLENKIKCASCGNLNEPGSAFCVRCGKKLSIN